MSVMDLSTSVLGQKISMPVCVGATAMQRMAHVDGETATAKGKPCKVPSAVRQRLFISNTVPSGCEAWLAFLFLMLWPGWA